MSLNIFDFIREDDIPLEDRATIDSRIMSIHGGVTLAFMPIDLIKWERKRLLMELYGKDLDVTMRPATTVESRDCCSICLEDIEKGEMISLLKCNHVLHPKCISEWVKVKLRCPMCRGQIEKNKEKQSKSALEMFGVFPPFINHEEDAEEDDYP